MDGKTEACVENGMAGNPDKFDVARKYSDEYYEEYIAAFRPNTKKRYVYRFCKRTLDIVLSLLAIIVFSPLFLAIAIAIKCDSKGPVLFKQKRGGAERKGVLLPEIPFDEDNGARGYGDFDSRSSRTVYDESGKVAAPIFAGRASASILLSFR